MHRGDRLNLGTVFFFLTVRQNHKMHVFFFLHKNYAHAHTYLHTRDKTDLQLMNCTENYFDLAEVMPSEKRTPLRVHDSTTTKHRKNSRESYVYNKIFIN